MKALTLSTLLAASLFITMSATAVPQAYNSKTTQNTTTVVANTGGFDGAHLNSKAGSKLAAAGFTGTTQVYSSKGVTNPAVANPLEVRSSEAMAKM